VLFRLCRGLGISGSGPAFSLAVGFDAVPSTQRWQALRWPDVLAHHNAELATLRTSLRARNVHRLDSIADKSGNDMARVQAVKTLEGLADASEQQHGAGQSRSPGVVIQILQPAAMPKIADMPIIRIEPSQMISSTGSV
jgi:hypothetical protein